MISGTNVPSGVAAGAAVSELRPLRRQVSGWGRFPRAETDLYRPERFRALSRVLDGAGSLVARGLGRSYGDACYNSAGATILMERLDRFLSFEPGAGIVECEPGVTFLDLLEHFLPRGFFPPVTPGTKYVTLGGALACDVHGKNHHVDGSFSRHVLDVDLLGADGEIRRCSRSENPDLFWATVGGLGLTGIVTRLRLRLRRVDSAYLSVDYERAGDIDDALARLAERDHAFTYSVAWIDCLARGGSLGRSVLMRGNAASADAVRAAGLDPWRGVGRPGLRVPLEAPGWLLNRYTVGAFNALYYRAHPGEARERLVHFEPYFYPLDGIAEWNRLYGRRGFVQYQLLVPAERGREALIDVLETVSASGRSSFLAVLKRFGRVEEPSLISFPRAGYTLALDLPWRGNATEDLLRRLDRIVVAAGGRVYLAKDARLDRGVAADMYPELPAWRAVKGSIDPAGRFSSDLGRRLGLVA